MVQTTEEKVKFTLGSRPYAPPEVFPKKLEPGKWLLLDPEMPNWILVDNLGKEIVELCDTKRSLEEITKIICARHDGDYASSKDNIVQFANLLAEKEFLSLQPFTYTLVEKNAVTGVEVVWLNVTNRCILRCLHCFRAAGEGTRNELSTREIFRLIDEFAELGGRELVISGGEPLLRKDTIDILEYAKGQGSISSLKLLTNGMLITPKVAKALKQLEPIYVQLSIDGGTAETHDKIRGKGSFAKLLEGIACLKEADFNDVVVASMTLMKLNVHEIEKCAALAKELGLHSIHFPVFQPQGRGIENEALLGLASDEVGNALYRCHQTELPASTALVPFPAAWRRAKRAKHDYCGAGITMWSIEPDGRVTPCPGLYEERFSAGNIRKQRLQEIAHTSRITKEFRALHVKESTKCGPCELRFICGGGCFINNFHKYGRLSGSGSHLNCDLERPAYWNMLPYNTLANIGKEGET
jgi:radical SAM protein with 4Fe4S-binding SPASM domain